MEKEHPFLFSFNLKVITAIGNKAHFGPQSHFIQQMANPFVAADFLVKRKHQENFLLT